MKDGHRWTTQPMTRTRLTAGATVEVLLNADCIIWRHQLAAERASSCAEALLEDSQIFAFASKHPGIPGRHLEESAVSDLR